MEPFNSKYQVEIYKMEWNHENEKGVKTEWRPSNKLFLHQNSWVKGAGMSPACVAESFWGPLQV